MIKQLKSHLKQRLLNTLNGYVLEPFSLKQKQAFSVQGLQKVLSHCYAGRDERVSFEEAGFSVYSEFGEDGILLYLFSVLGHGNRRLVEIGCGTGNQSNSANLVVNHYWNALLVDADADNCRLAEQFFTQVPSCKLLTPHILNRFVTPENVNDLVSKEGGILGDIDLLSLDIDSVDLWVLEALSEVRPRVIVLEINSRWGAGESMTVPKNGKGAPVFLDNLGMVFAGASLNAFTKFLEPRGYRLVGSNHVATNVFFVLEDLCDKRLPSVTIESVLTLPRALHIRGLCKDVLANYPWVEY